MKVRSDSILMNFSYAPLGLINNKSIVESQIDYFLSTIAQLLFQLSV